MITSKISFFPKLSPVIVDPRNILFVLVCCGPVVREGVVNGTLFK